MKHKTKLTSISEAWRTVARVGVLVGILLLAAATGNAYTLLNLTGDVGQSTPDYIFPTALALAGTTNDPFAYNLLSPTAPLPVRSYTGATPNGFHGSNQPSVVVAYTFGTVVGGDIIFDLYGRSDGGGAEFRDNGMVLRLYNGDWVTPVFTSSPFDIPDGAPFYTRFTSPVGLFSDRVSLTGPAYFTLMEIRAVVPEPSISLLAIVGGACLLRRRRS